MKTFLLISALFVATLRMNAQIALEQTYPRLMVHKLDVSGVKYLVDSSTNTSFNLKLYNTNHTLFKSINFANPYPNFSHVIQYITENLFDMDAEVEFAVTFTNAPTSQRFAIFNEDGSILFNKNNAALWGTGTSPLANGPYLGIIPTTDGTKMILQIFNPTSSKVYSLPGTVPCWECNGGYTGNRETSPAELQQANSKMFPNPSSGQSQIDYDLPIGCKTATLTVFSVDGKPIKSFTITSDFDSILLSNDDLPSGNYFYQIETPNKMFEGKQFEIIR